MRIELIELDEFDCRVGHIYSVAIDDSDNTLFDLFLEENDEEFRKELGTIMTKLNAMSARTGFGDFYFKLNEGKPGDGLCAITDIKGKLRLYCIRFGNVLLVLGGGGAKTTRTYQEDDKLYSENLQLRLISEAMTKAIKDGTLRIEDDGRLTGDLVLEL